MSCERITSKSNPSVKLYQKLSSQKKERQRYGLFVLEGERITEDALKAEAVRTLLMTEKAYEESRLRELYDCPETLVISDELARYISQTETPQGVFAVCRMYERPPVISDGGRYIVLYGLQDPGNMGTIIRTADALGIDGIYLCGCCDLYNPKTIRATMGSVFRCRIGTAADDGELFSVLSGGNILTAASVIDSGAEPVMSLTELPENCRLAVFIGNEGRGLPEDIPVRCDMRITIPMHGNINSLNAAMAAGIIMWEMKK